MKFLNKIKADFEVMRVEKATKRYLKNYWKRVNSGEPVSREETEVASRVIDNRVKIASQKKEIKSLRKKARSMWWKCFYVDYLATFVFSDKGQVFYRGTFWSGVLNTIAFNIHMKFALSPIGGYKVRENPFIAKRLYCYVGLKKAMKETGYPQEVLLKSDEEIMAEKSGELSRDCFR